MSTHYNHSLPIEPQSFLRERRFLHVLVVFRVDLSQISFNPAKNALASRPLGFLATSIAVCDILTRGMCRNQNFEIVFGGESDLRL